jgi:hypothetical protein
MTTGVQRRRGTTVQHSTFTGLDGEITIDTTKDTAVVHDGATVGGHPLARQDLGNVDPTALSAITGSNTASGDLFIIYDVSTNSIKKITRDELNNAIEQDALANVTITGGSINGTTIGASTASTGAFTSLSASGAFSANGGTTLGDASGDALTINSSAVSIPNGLNFGSNQFVITSAGNIGVGTASPLSATGYVQQTINGTTGSYLTLQRGGTSTAQIGAEGNDVFLNSMTATGALRIQTNSTERMRITSAGNVGIGTSSPDQKLTIVGNQKITGYIELRSANRLYFNDSGNTNSGSIWNNATGGALSFAGAGSTEQMRLDSSGNLGLGVTPSASTVRAFQVSGSTVIGSQNEGLNITTNAYFDSSWKRHITGTATWYQQATGQHAWFTAPSGTAGATPTFTQAMTLDASGNLIVGGTTGLNLGSGRGNLTVNGATDAILNFGINSVARGYLYHSGTNMELFNSAAGYLNFATSNTERMRIDSSGNVGIGTSSPDSKLHVLDSSGNSIRVGFSPGVNNFNLYDANGHIFRNAGGTTEVMRIDSSGNVGIGTTSPNIFSRGYSTMLTASSSSGTAAVQINSATGNTAWLDMGANGTRLGTLAASSSIFEIGTGTALPLAFFTNANYRLYITSAGDVGIGTNGPSSSLTVQRTSAAASLGIRHTASGNGYGYIFSTTGTTTNDLTISSEFNGSATERMRIDSSGNVMIGRTSSAGRLSIQTAGGATNALDLYSPSTTNGARIQLNDNLYSTAIYSIPTGGASALGFEASGAERMRINSSGSLLVGTTAQVSATVPGLQYDPNAALSLARTGTGTVAAVYFYNGNGVVGQINTSGSSTSYVTSSDYRLKENIAPMTGALDKVQALKPVTYKWKVDGSDGQGFIAHELQEVVPDCVTGEKDAVDEEGNPIHQGIDTSFLVATLTAAIQEQQAIINDLKARIETLESK